MKKTILLFLLALSFLSFSQEFRTMETEVECNEITYKLSEVWYVRYDCFIENKANHMRDQLRYKVGSNPVRYYTEATGMGEFADVDTTSFNSIVRSVFTPEEIRRYTDARGGIYIGFVVDPNSGRVLEVRFDLTANKQDTGVFTELLTMEKFYQLEKQFKENLVCGISEKLKSQKQSYTLAGINLF